ncbi:hypothetical protein ERO13_A07G022550v2 [Gossypium hirsutum]|uniref:Uncharacterized protein n=1 Tax=Gossypium darwinii TaxID=34276 RepID=A0A5D2FR87_GOSDA|nr:hypothetical protein ERO13_A07G022550v2 [Gossypium hirsutum]TYH08587.1 hypothetical protein ES288_A07G027900v1 [Gossypium darwinii]
MHAASVAIFVLRRISFVLSRLSAINQIKFLPAPDKTGTKSAPAHVFQWPSPSRANIE